MKILITGINGFAGSHLAEFLLKHKLGQVHGTRRHFRSDIENIKEFATRVTLHDCDLQDLGATHRVIKNLKPDIIFHLAAQSFVADSYKNPGQTLRNNIDGALNILEAVRIERDHDKIYDPTIHLAGSSEEYGLVLPEDVPITETNQLCPQSPYGVSKVAQTLLAISYCRTYEISIIVTRAFNHTGLRRGEAFATSTFAKQIAEIEHGLKPPIIYHGNLDAKRDFTDVRDIVQAYWLAAIQCKSGEIYNVCSGVAFSIRQVLNYLVSKSLSNIESREDPERRRPSDIPILLGDSTKFRETTGWKPEIPLEKTLLDLLNYWRDKVKRSH